MRNLTDEFLQELFYLCIKDKNIFTVVKEHMKSNFLFNEEYRELWSRIVRYYKINDRKPSFGILKQIIQNDNKNNKLDDILILLDSIKKISIDNTEDVLRGFEDYIKQNKFIELYEITGQTYNKGDKEKAYNLFSKGAEDLNNFSISGVKFEKVFKEFNTRMIDRISGNYDNRHTIPFLIDPIDLATNGGAVTGETELWLGDSGVGKSKLLVGRSISSARSGYKVLHVQAEGTKQQCMDNFDSCWTGMLYKDIKSGQIDQTKFKAYRKVVDNIGRGEIYVKTSDKFGTLTIGDVRNWIIEIIREFGELHHLVLDYMDLIDPAGDSDKYGRGGDGERLRQIETARQLKNLAVEFNILVTTATQSSDIPQELRENPEFVITRSYLGNAKRKVEPFSYFFTINQTPDEKRLQICRILAEKFREHDSFIIWKIKQSLRNSRFYDRKTTFQMWDEEELLEEMRESGSKNNSKKNDKR